MNRSERVITALNGLAREKVRNMKGTGGDKAPDGLSWKAWWEKNSNKKFDLCSCCGSKAEDGSHVKKVNVDDRSCYIVPLCHKCNESPDPIDVNSGDLVLFIP